MGREAPPEAYGGDLRSPPHLRASGVGIGGGSSASSAGSEASGPGSSKSSSSSSSEVKSSTSDSSSSSETSSGDDSGHGGHAVAAGGGGQAVTGPPAIVYNVPGKGRVQWHPGSSHFVAYCCRENHNHDQRNPCKRIRIGLEGKRAAQGRPVASLVAWVEDGNRGLGPKTWSQPGGASRPRGPPRPEASRGGEVFEKIINLKIAPPPLPPSPPVAFQEFFDIHHPGRPPGGPGGSGGPGPGGPPAGLAPPFGTTSPAHRRGRDALGSARPRRSTLLLVERSQHY